MPPYHSGICGKTDSIIYLLILVLRSNINCMSQWHIVRSTMKYRCSTPVVGEICRMTCSVVRWLLWRLSLIFVSSFQQQLLQSIPYDTTERSVAPTQCFWQLNRCRVFWKTSLIHIGQPLLKYEEERRLYIITRQNHNYYTLKVVLRWSPCCNVFGNLTGVGVIILYTNTSLTCREMMSPSRLIIRSGNSLLLTRRTIVLLPTLLVCYISSLVLRSVFSCYLKVWCVLVCSNVWSSSSILVYIPVPVYIVCVTLTYESSFV